jgi:phospholipid/cholesterol/gamma-HCH transport system substrate-binding protein
MSKEVRLGLFIVVTLAILFAGVFLIGNTETLFKSTYRVKAEFQNVAGLSDGADVRVGGIHEGTVRKIALPSHPDGKVTVMMDLQRATRDIVKTDSLAAIKSEGLLGDKYIEVSFGSKDAGRLKDGETIGSEPPLDISDLLSKTNQILDTTKTAMEGAQETVNNLQSITSKIDHGKGSVGALINDKTVYNQATAAATNLSESTEALKHNFLVRGFFKNRGYEDASDLTKYQIAKLPAEPSVKTFSYDGKRIFDKPDASKLQNEKVLNEAGQYLEQNKFGLAVVTSTAGVKGDSEKDRVLTEARAFVVRDYLVKNFKVDDTRVKTIGLGKAETANQEQKVEILVYPASTDVPPQAQPRQAAAH